MEQTERIHLIKEWLDAGQWLSRSHLQQQLGVSAATVKRDIAHLRLYRNAPIVFDR